MSLAQPCQSPALTYRVAWGGPFLFLHMSISYPKTPCALAHFASEPGAVIFHSEKRNKKFRIFVSFVFTPIFFFFLVLLFHVSAALCSFHTLQPDGSGGRTKATKKWAGRKRERSRELKVKAKPEIEAKPRIFNH